MGWERGAAVFLIIAAGTAGRAAAAAEPFDVRLGLWEVTHTTNTQGTPPFDTSKLTPEQRQKLEAAFQAQQGTRTRTVRSCLTKEKLEKDPFADETDGSCKRTVISSTRKVREVKMECAGEHPMTGHIRFEAVSPERVKGNSDVVVGEGGRTMNVKSTFAARWLGSDCGKVE